MRTTTIGRQIEDGKKSRSREKGGPQRVDSHIDRTGCLNGESAGLRELCKRACDAQLLNNIPIWQRYRRAEARRRCARKGESLNR